jgi:hypothetical protein
MTVAARVAPLADRFRAAKAAAMEGVSVQRANDLDHSAAGLAYHPLKQLNHLAALVNRALQRPAISSLPIEIQLNNIGFCNLRCPQCPTHGTDERHEIYQAKSFTMPRAAIEKAAADNFPHALKVATSGLGEGLLHRDYDAIVAGASRFGVQIFTNSNGTTLLPKRLRGLFGISELRLSLDGATPRTFEAIRRGAKFAKVMRNILALTRANELLPPELRLIGTINFGICASNARDLPLIVDMCAHLGLLAVHGFFMEMSCNPAYAADDIAKYPAYYKHYYEQAMQRAKARSIVINLPAPRHDVEPDPKAGPSSHDGLIVPEIDDRYYQQLPIYERLIDLSDIEPEVEAMAVAALESAIERHESATPERKRQANDEARTLHEALTADMNRTISSLPAAEAMRLRHMHSSSREVNNCNFLLQYLNYQPDGAVFPCCQADIAPVGDRSMAARDILRSKAMETLLGEFRTGQFRDICKGCVFNARKPEKHLFPMKLG